VKTPGSDSFMTPETLEFVREIVAIAREAGLRVLVEVHAHYTQQLAIAPLVDVVYDFALAPLLLHSLGTGTSDRLVEWLRIRPRNAITVLDTHDGIGIIDAGPSADRPGLIDHDEMAAIFERAAVATNGHSSIASVIPAWMSLPHQINATFFSVLGGDAERYLLARAVQLWLPGRPQLYYVGLLGGRDDVALFQRTGQGRDVNRHVYTPGEVEAALASEVTRAQLALVRLRSAHPAFDGEFGYRVEADGSLELEWANGDDRAVLTVRFGPEPAFRIRTTAAPLSGVPTAADTVEALAAL
jgi:sucrose phosphorylase